ncbi:MAG TPA: 2-oxo acid dehydrogenase subunit E2, partial [Flavobacteriales bacterium]|nr:2-oxo acid dehydrogenase subunit E2 [Flavobacteriales bacterium]HIN38840.1 2-oxo acid dehydrogenase subunit E2 [Flavobacteriales bacterium]
MPQTELILPKMGESVAEATIIKWLKAEGDVVAPDEAIVEIATDKVDSEIPAPIGGVLSKILSQEGETVLVGTTIAIISDEGEEVKLTDTPDQKIVNEEIPIETSDQNQPKFETDQHAPEPSLDLSLKPESNLITEPIISRSSSNTPRFHNGRFFSPLVRKIAQEEGVTNEELQKIAGNGQNGRVTKNDILSFINTRSELSKDTGAKPIIEQSPAYPPIESTTQPVPKAETIQTIPVAPGEDEVIQMDRMRKMIAEHMVLSKHTSPHVTSFVEADVSNIVLWRNKVKDEFAKRENEKITFTPIFIEAVSKAIRDFPMINVQVDGDNIILKKNINIGMAVALNSGNLIVPVIKNADRMNLYGLSKAVNDLAVRARDNKLGPDEIQGGTFTMTNVGTFGNLSGTPIIN